jgi:methyl-accepting chemotaxis protein
MALAKKGIGWLQRLKGFKFKFNFNFNLFSKVRVFHQILIVLAVMVVFNVLEGYLSLKNIDGMQEVTRSIFLQSTQNTESITTAKEQIVEIRRQYIMYMTGLSPLGPDASSFANSMENLKTVGVDAVAVSGYIEEIRQVLALPITPENYDEFNKKLSFIELDLNRYDKQMSDKTLQAMDLGNRFTESSRNTTMIILVVSIAVAVVLGFLVSRSISRPLKRAVVMIQEMSRGHLGLRLNMKSQGEIGVMAKNMDRFAEDLQQNIIGTMQKIAAGDLNTEVALKDERDEIGPALRTTIESLRSLANDVNMLSTAAIEGRFSVRADASKYEGDYKAIVEGINATLSTVVDKVFWYEALLDAIPFPISVTDNDMKWTFINRPVERVMDLKREEILGQSCVNWNADICNTENCSIARLRNGYSQTFFDHQGMHFQADTSYIHNIKGEVVGHIELMQDITAKTKSVDYQKDEVERLAGNLQLLAKGRLDLDLNVAEGDEYTQVERENFTQINQNLQLVKDALGALIEDANLLERAALEGKLDIRADLGRHEGDYRKIIEGVNNSLDAVIGPLDEAIGVLGKMAVNDYTLQMAGSYQGMLAEFASAIDMVETRLLSVQDIATRVAKGDVSQLEEFYQSGNGGRLSENDMLMPAFITMMETIQNLAGEVNRLTKAATEGDLEVRGEADKFEGLYHQIVSGINQTLDAMVAPLGETIQVLDRMADNDYTSVMNEDYQGAFLKLARAVNGVQETLNQVLSEINIAAVQIASGSRQVADGSEQLSQGATEQASSIEELSATIMEIAAQTRKNASNANEANSLSLTAKDWAVQGNEQMKGMLQSMAEIQESSKSISKIIKVIDEIAFQTNILALNAAVEAARAGQHGKGFAVVAEEVRNLAARSANAAKETTDLIESSIKRVEGGTKIAKETAAALDKIVDGVAKASNFVGEIAAASNEQATGIGQINQGIEQVSRVVQTNTSTSEQSAAASQELSSQAEGLKQLVTRFRLKEGYDSSQGLVAVALEQEPTPHPVSHPAPSLESKPAAKRTRPRAAADKGTLTDREFGKY